MDKETIALVEDVRKSLVDFAKTQSTSALKKTRKITSQIIWEPGPYLNELDNILSTSKDKETAVKRIRSLVRKSEEDALKTMNLLPDDTMHHIVQSRTGGDALTDISYERTGPIISGLSEKHQMTFGNTTGPGSNLPAESSLSNFAHKSDDKATGLEREADIGVNPDKKSTAHPGHTAEHAHMKGVDMTSDKAIAEALDDKVTRQIAAANTAFQTDAPRQQAIKELVPGAYSGTAADVAEARKVIQPQLLTNRSAILDSYRKLRLGKIANKIPVLGGAVMATGTLLATGEAGQAAKAFVETENPVENLDAGPIFDESQDYGVALRQAAQQNAKPLFDRLRQGALGTRAIRGRSGAQRALQQR